jgi:hypothetical protein
MGPLEEPPYSLWYLSVYDEGGKVRAEISMPIEFSGGYIVKCSERIFIVQGDDWDKISVERPADDGPQEYDINVRRK